MKKTKRIIHRGGNSHQAHVRPLQPEPIPACQHPTRTELCTDYGTYLNTGIMPERFQLAKNCHRCWFTAQVITMHC